MGISSCIHFVLSQIVDRFKCIAFRITDIEVLPIRESEAIHIAEGGAVVHSEDWLISDPQDSLHSIRLGYWVPGTVMVALGLLPQYAVGFEDGGVLKLSDLLKFVEIGLGKDGVRHGVSCVADTHVEGLPHYI